MGKKVKTGKRRKDKYYHLAKETGYRARSAFKLIQLNRKFNFLQESRVLIDLCAAPGGWLQVASNFMPVSSIIIGIDLVHIKPIKNVTTFQADITADHCRQLLKKELKGWKSDVVLNDGAPNVGTAWVQDAFSQAQLALSALKLASEFLKKDGWFITKVFRSKDYTALLWVFQQLFKKVHSTKPQASRHESAEIFVVCQGYLAPDKLDPKFLDPKHVFKEIQDESKIKLNLLKPEKYTRQREGYPENNPTLHTTITAREFITSQTALELLATTNKIDITDEEIKSNTLTTAEIVECCQDIKVLGKKELKNLLTWRKKLRKVLKLEIESSEKNDDSKIELAEKTEEQKQEEIDQMVSDLKEEEDKDLKRKRKKVRENKKKLRERLANKLADTSGEDGGMDQDLFTLNLMKNKKEVDDIADEDGDVYFEDSDEQLEFESDEDDESNDETTDEESYIYGDDELYEKPSKKKKIAAIDSNQIKKKKRVKKSDNPLLIDVGEKEEDEETKAVNKAKQWYQKDVFQNVDDDGDDDDMNDEYDIELMLQEHKKKGGKLTETKKDSNVIGNGDESNVGDVNNDGSDVVDDSDDSGDDTDVDDRSISIGRAAEEKARQDNKQLKVSKKNGFEIAPQVELGPEALALGTAMVTSKKRKRDIIDDSYNRYCYNDDNLPSWFKEDEARHTIRHVPITREEVEFYKQRLRELNARPIKKVIEAKAKKKSQMLKKLEQARRKAQGILDATDVSAREKQDQIKGIYKRAGLTKKKHPKPTFVVAKKGLAGKKYRRPDGVKGTFKVVDPRMKKDLRAMKNKEKTKGRSKKKR